MADQTITPVAMSLNAFTDAVQAGASLTTSNDGLCLLPKDGKHVILLKVTEKGTTGTITLKAPTAGLGGFMEGQGDYEFSTAALTNDDWIALSLESARFKGLTAAAFGGSGELGRIRIELGGTNTTATAVCLTLP